MKSILRKIKRRNCLNRACTECNWNWDKQGCYLFPHVWNILDNI